MKTIISNNRDTNIIINKELDIINEKNNIYLITQFYLSNNNSRTNEIKETLKRNIKLGIFSTIYLINERNYTKEELGLNDDDLKTIKQIIFDKGSRMTYMHCFGLVKALKLNGYIIIANSDIFFDNTLLNLEKTSLSKTKSVYALLRFEFKNEKNLNDCKIFGPRNDSQDTWIFHSKFLPSDNQIIRTNFLLGKAGCDNAIAYLFNDFGFIVFNEPYVIRTYHYHLSQIRNYTAIDKINPPYLLIKPIERSDLQIRS